MMPYYRIVIWTKKRVKPYQGIRWIDHPNINSLQSIVYRKAEEIYRTNLVDVEVQMLSKLSTAVRKYIERKGPGGAPKINLL